MGTSHCHRVILNYSEDLKEKCRIKKKMKLKTGCVIKKFPNGLQEQSLFNEGQYV